VNAAALEHTGWAKTKTKQAVDYKRVCMGVRTWGQLTSLEKMDEKLKSENMQKRE